MDRKNDCAFPADNRTHTDGGLTKLEYFTAMAMQGLLANSDWAKTMRVPDDWDEYTARLSSAANEIASATLDKINPTKTPNP